MVDTLRNDTSIAVFLSRLAKGMEKRPDLTFGQLMYESLQDHAGHDQPLDVAINMRRLSDNQIAEAVERYVLKG